jgi:hypothetical protein
LSIRVPAYKRTAVVLLLASLLAVTGCDSGRSADHPSSSRADTWTFAPTPICPALSAAMHTVTRSTRTLSSWRTAHC